MEYKIEKEIEGLERFLVVQWVKDLLLALSGLGHCCGVGLIPCPGTSTCPGHV